ncbi:unnamed protein product [Parajaminaea phylloscopi]
MPEWQQPTSISGSGKRKYGDDPHSAAAQTPDAEPEPKRSRHGVSRNTPGSSDGHLIEMLGNTSLRLMNEMQQLKASNAELVKAVGAIMARQSRDTHSRHDTPEIAPAPPIPVSARTVQAPSSPSSATTSMAVCKCTVLTHQRIAAFLPDGRLLRGLIGHFLYRVAPLVPFVDPTQVMLDVEEIEEGRETLRLRGPADTRSLPGRVEDFCVKIAMLLAFMSLAVVHLDSSKASELGITHNKVDRLSRELWSRSRHILALLTSLATMKTPSNSAASSYPSGMATPIDSYGNIMDGGVEATSPPQRKDLALSAENLLDVSAASIVLLVASSSLSPKLEYLRMLTDAVFYSHAAALDRSDDPTLPLVLREYRWQLAAFLCCIDWTAASLFHDSTCLTRSEQLRNPPSRLCGFVNSEEEGRALPLSNSSFCREEHRFRQFAQTRYYLKHALVIAHLSRRIEECTRRSMQLSPDEAVSLCAEMGDMETKLDYYQSYYHFADEIAPRFRYSTADLRSSLEVQQWQLRLQLAQTKFKLYRHQALFLLRTNPTHRLTQIFTDECTEACTSVLSLCRATLSFDPVDESGPAAHTLGPEHDLLGARARRKLYDHAGLRASAGVGEEEEERSSSSTTKWGSRTLRKVIRPACAAAAVGQVLLRSFVAQPASSSSSSVPAPNAPSSQHHAMPAQAQHGSRMHPTPTAAASIQMASSTATSTPAVGSAPIGGGGGVADKDAGISSLAKAAYWTTPSGVGGGAQGAPQHHHLPNPSGGKAHGTSTTPLETHCPPTPTRRTSKARMLAWHVHTLMSELESLEGTLELARDRLSEIRRAGCEDGL